MNHVELLNNKIELSNYDTVYSTYSQQRHNLIEAFDQMFCWHQKLGFLFQEKVFNAFLNENAGSVLCDEY